MRFTNMPFHRTSLVARRASFFVPAFLIAAGVLCTTGCGGGGAVGGTTSNVSGNGSGSSTATDGGSTPSPSASTGTSGSSSGPFTPNYRSDIGALRHWATAIVTVSYTAPAPDSNGNVRDIGPLLQQAIANWNAKVGGSIMLQLVNGPTSDVTVTLVPSGTLPSGAIGRTEVTFTNADQVLQSAVVRVDQTLNDDQATQVLTHELGHALGIDGHSSDSNDLMYYRAHLPTVITQKDMDTVLLAYNGGADRAAGQRMVRGTSAGLVTTVSYSSAAAGDPCICRLVRVTRPTGATARKRRG